MSALTSIVPSIKIWYLIDGVSKMGWKLQVASPADSLRDSSRAPPPHDAQSQRTSRFYKCSLNP